MFKSIVNGLVAATIAMSATSAAFAGEFRGVDVPKFKVAVGWSSDNGIGSDQDWTATKININGRSVTLSNELHVSGAVSGDPKYGTTWYLTRRAYEAGYAAAVHGEDDFSLNKNPTVSRTQKKYNAGAAQQTFKIRYAKLQDGTRIVPQSTRETTFSSKRHDAEKIKTGVRSAVRAAFKIGYQQAQKDGVFNTK